MAFDALGLDPQILSALKEQGYTTPTPIQAQSIPVLLEGSDLLGTAQTGTGKTAAFVIPIIQHLLSQPKSNRRQVKALVVAPTRELALQVGENAKRYSKNTGLRTAVIFGGVGQGPQVDQLRRGVDILVATPGRLLDLENQGHADLSNISHFVLDEADQMLDMGFIHDIRKLLRIIPAKRQSLFFSATMPKSIIELSSQILRPNYKSVRIAVDKPTAERVTQCVYQVSKKEKPALLLHLLKEIKGAVLVFGRTKHGCDIRVLIATDIAARGIDISGLEHVVNFELPNVSETYVHRIGRTGRADASGSSISFCSADERGYLKDIEKLISQEIDLVSKHPFTEGAAIEWSDPENRKPIKQGGGGGRGRGQRPQQGGGSSRPRSNDGNSRGSRPAKRKW